MYRKILSFILILCLCMSIMPDINVYAMEEQENQEIACIAADDIWTDEQIADAESEIDIPQNGSQVHMEDIAAVPSKTGRRLMKKASNERYTVLVLDTSDSVHFQYHNSVFYTADTAFPYVHASAKKFIENISDASGENYIAIVSYSRGTSQVVSQFTNDTDTLLDAMDSLGWPAGGSNVHSALTAAEELIDSVPDKSAVKNVVLFTTGLTCTGPYSYDGHYNKSTVGSRWYDTTTNIPLYTYANSAYAAAENLKKKCTLYSIGLFQVMDDMPEQGRDVVKFFKLCACDWASSKKHFYDIKDPTYLEFAFGEVADNIIRCKGIFSYPGSGEDYTATYYYDDNYFSEDSYVYNQHLATMSLCLDLSSWGSEDESDYTRKMKNAEELLNEIGFIGFDHNYTDFTEEGINGKPTKDSVGVVAANKLLSFDGKDYTLIAVAIRGGGYEREWASNFTIGKSGDHEGFAKARDIVIEFLERYIKEQRISGDIKIWITGYSRAGATANMVAGAIDKGDVALEGCRLELKDMFAYTFEAPAGVMDSDATNKKYSNIFNIINANDPVPLVAPNDWKFTRYGKDHPIPTQLTDDVDVYKEKKAAMLWEYKRMGGYKGYKVDDFEALEVDPKNILEGYTSGIKPTKGEYQENFLNDFVSLMAKNYLKNRTNYVENYQNGIRDIAGILFGTSSIKKGVFWVNLGEELVLYEPIIINQAKFYGKEAASQKIAECIRKSLKKAQITNYNEDEFEDSVVKIADLLAEIACNNPNGFVTLIHNRKKIVQAHYPELCLAWMQSMDSNYTSGAEPYFSTGKYRIVRINCPIDVRVYDAEGNILASIIGDTPQPDAHVLVSFNSEGEKLVYLPVYKDYAIKLTATDDGVMNYAVQEYDFYAGETNHMVLFNDIELKKGQEYMAYLPSYSEEDIESRTGTAADTDYTMFLGSTQIMFSEELAGEEVFNAYYDINAVTDDAEKGFVWGSGIRQYGTFAKLEAVAFDGYEFAGWYEGENLVSTDEEYRFRVSNDIELVAVFKESTQEKTPEENTGDNTDKESGESADKESGESIEKESGENTDKESEENTGENTGKDTEDRREGTIEGAFRVVAHWNTGFNAEITLTNTTEEVIHNWTVAFDLPYEITNIWNGVIVSRENEVYTVQNVGYNWDILPGESVTFGFCANAETESITEPSYYTLIEKPVKVVQQEYKVAYKVNSDWKTAFNGQIEITNMSSEEIADWTLEFDSAHNFNQLWNAEIVSHKGNHYIIKNRGYNAVIWPGQTLVLGFEASCGNSGSRDEPTNYHLIIN